MEKGTIAKVDFNSLVYPSSADNCFIKPSSDDRPVHYLDNPSSDTFLLFSFTQAQFS